MYLSGGVNTGSDWSSWTSPPGSFAGNYLNASSAAGYLTVFDWYEILPSLPHVGTGEKAQDLSNLVNTSTMAAYYADWKLLLTQAKAFGKPLIIHVEPDMWGYIHMTYGDSSTAAPVSVASSGYPDVLAYPNTAAGFAQALVHMRDVYAPNAILAYHVSNWAVDGDVATSTLTDYDVHGKAVRDAAFFNSLGANFDLLFYSPSEGDAGWYQYVQHDGGGHWWDETNQTVPNFSRYAEWVGYVNAYTNRRAMFWEVPIGNKIYDTENNTNGHYQDNRVDYLLGSNWKADLAQFANVGVIGILFGRGVPGSTSNEDTMGDGITNPPPIDGNVAVSTVSDDDGGYLRLRAANFYASGGLPLP
jgi:hypothetical protein